MRKVATEVAAEAVIVEHALARAAVEAVVPPAAAVAAVVALMVL